MWSSEVNIPLFSVATEAVLKNENEQFLKDGSVFNNTQVKSEIMEKLADYIYGCIAYPTRLQVGQVVEALIKKTPMSNRTWRLQWMDWMNVQPQAQNGEF